MSDAEKLAHAIAAYDFEHGDLLCLKFGGDGDNGEALIEALAHVLANQEPPPVAATGDEKDSALFNTLYLLRMFAFDKDLPEHAQTTAREMYERFAHLMRGPKEPPQRSSADGESLKEKFTFSLSFGTSAVHTRGTPLNVVINGQELTQAEAIEAFMKLWAKPNQDAVSVTLTTSDESGKPAKPLVSPTSGYCLDADGKMMRISDINKEGGKDD
jgi:hypothetical protein